MRPVQNWHDFLQFYWQMVGFESENSCKCVKYMGMTTMWNLSPANCLPSLISVLQLNRLGWSGISVFIVFIAEEFLEFFTVTLSWDHLMLDFQMFDLLQVNNFQHVGGRLPMIIDPKMRIICIAQHANRKLFADSSRS